MSTVSASIANGINANTTTKADQTTLKQNGVFHSLSLLASPSLKKKEEWGAVIEAFKQDPQNSKAFLAAMYGRARYLEQKGKHADVIDLFREAAETAKRLGQKEVAAEALAAIPSCYLKNIIGNVTMFKNLMANARLLDAAAGAYEEALELAPNHADREKWQKGMESAKERFLDIVNSMEKDLYGTKDLGRMIEMAVEIAGVMERHYPQKAIQHLKNAKGYLGRWHDLQADEIDGNGQARSASGERHRDALKAGLKEESDGLDRRISALGERIAKPQKKDGLTTQQNQNDGGAQTAKEEFGQDVHTLAQMAKARQKTASYMASINI